MPAHQYGLMSYRLPKTGNAPTPHLDSNATMGRRDPLDIPCLRFVHQPTTIRFGCCHQEDSHVTPAPDSLSNLPDGCARVCTGGLRIACAAEARCAIAGATRGRTRRRMESLEARPLVKPPFRSKAEIQANIEALEVERAQLLARYFTPHPEIKDIDRKLEILNTQLKMLE